MKITVTDEVLKQTTRCPNNFSCLDTGSCGNFPACSVETSYNQDVFSVKNKNIINISLCPYELSFKREYICQCPTHAALIKELKKNNHSLPESGVKENTASLSSKSTSKSSPG